MFQPHRYSRLKHCKTGFLNCFSEADRLFVLPVYPAGEKPLAGVSSKDLVHSIKKPEALFIEERDIFSVFSKELKAKDVFVTLGAGSICRFGETLLSQLKKLEG